MNTRITRHLSVAVVCLSPWLMTGGVTYVPDKLLPTTAQAQKGGLAWVSAENRDGFANGPQTMLASGRWQVTFCNGTRTTSSLAVLNDLIAAGIPLVDGGSRFCAKETDLKWMFTRDSSGKFIVNSESYLRLVTANDDTAAQFFDEGDVIAATVTRVIDTYVNGTWSMDKYDGGTLTSRSLGWDIVFNGTSGNVFMPGKPSQNTEVGEQDYFQYDVLLHEIMHVLGADHVEASATDPVPATTMFVSVGGAGHFGTEYDADLWHPDGAVAGERNIPIADLLFLYNWYPGVVLDPPDVPRVHTWKPLQILDQWAVKPFGPALGFEGPYRAYFLLDGMCEHDVLDPSDAALVRDYLPGLSTVDAEFHNAVVSVVDETDLGVFDFQGYVTYTTDDHGALWSTDMVGDPLSPLGTPWIGGDFWNQREYDREGRLKIHFVGLDKSFELPFKLTIKAACPCNGTPGVPGCCVVECEE